MEPLDPRMLLAVNFSFNILDPSGKYNSLRPKLQALLNAAGEEWSTHMQGNANLQYDVSFSETAPTPLHNQPPILADGAAKSAQIVHNDVLTGLPVYRVGTMTEVVTGDDPNGARADAGITIYGPNIDKWFFETDFNRRSAPIPVGQFDGYTVLLHELAHSLGFASTRDPVGEIPSVGMYTFDQHVKVFRPGFLSYGLFAFEQEQAGFPNPANDITVEIYGNSVAMEIGNPNHLGTGSPSDAILRNPTVAASFINIPPELLDDLSTDLMGGPIYPGERKTISRLDLAILRDAGLPVDVTPIEPEGLYTINGTGFGDVIDVSSQNNNLLIRVNKTSTSILGDDPLAPIITAIVINGLNGNDVITISGNAPAVAINGGAGHDTIFGGPRGDSIYGGGGNDLIYGIGGGDFIRGGEGDDSIYGQGGSDRLFGNGGRDFLDGGLQTDRVYGGNSNDTVVGGTEDDFLYGEAGADVLSGAGGKDRMDGGLGADIFYGGAGNDSVDYSRSPAAVRVSIDGVADDGTDGEQDNIIDSENVIGSNFDDLLIGDPGRNSLIGGAGNDTLDGDGFHDTLEGNGGNDELRGSDGHDSLFGGAGTDLLIGGSGLDHMLGDDGDDTFDAEDDEIDTLEGGAGDDTATGDLNDVMSGIETTNLDNPPPLPAPLPLATSRAAQSVLLEEEEPWL